MNPYRTGYIAGLREPRAVRINGHKILEAPVCPYPAWRFLSYALWHDGLHSGTMARLTSKQKGITI